VSSERHAVVIDWHRIFLTDAWQLHNVTQQACRLADVRYFTVAAVLVLLLLIDDVIDGSPRV